MQTCSLLRRGRQQCRREGCLADMPGTGFACFSSAFLGSSLGSFPCCAAPKLCMWLNPLETLISAPVDGYSVNG